MEVKGTGNSANNINIHFNQDEIHAKKYAEKGWLKTFNEEQRQILALRNMNRRIKTLYRKKMYMLTSTSIGVAVSLVLLLCFYIFSTKNITPEELICQHFQSATESLKRYHTPHVNFGNFNNAIIAASSTPQKINLSGNFAKGLIYLEKREYSLAINEFYSCVNDSVVGPEAKLNLGLCLIAVGENSDAFAVLDGLTKENTPFSIAAKQILSSHFVYFSSKPSVKN